MFQDTKVILNRFGITIIIFILQNSDCKFGWELKVMYFND